MAKQTREQRIETEIAKLMEIFRELPEKKLKLITPTIENACFMKVTLEDLRENIINEGTKEKYQNSETQFGFKKSTSLSAYNSLIKNYTSTIDRLEKYLPTEVAKAGKLSEFTGE